MRKPSFNVLTVFWIIMPFTFLFGAAFDPSTVKKDPNYFYGFGTGKTVQEAQQIALNELISDALTQTKSVRTDTDNKIAITTDMSKAFKLPDIRPFINQKDGDVFAVGYRIERTEWAKREVPRQAALRTDFVAQFKAISADDSKNLQDRLKDAGTLLVRINDAGIYDVLTETENGNSLISKGIEEFYSKLIADLKITITPENGLIHSGTRFTATVTRGNGNPVPSFPLSFMWRIAKKENKPNTISSDDAGKVDVPFPTEDFFKNRSVWLKIGTSFSAQVPQSRFLSQLDAQYSHEYQYRHLEIAKTISADEVTIAGGPFQAGAVPQDRRAAATKEKKRPVTLNSFAIDRYPVTNALYGAYLDDAKIPEAQYPDYWDNPDYNQPDQPVIGITWEDANNFAKWLSSRLGYAKRLPTEDEYERAARGGQATVYPWGDQPPSDTIRANYNGNTKYDATSPVGAFANGKNPLGLFDMAGNVWEWTSSSPDKNMTDDAAWKIVKGGSWMDGPAELRVSNRRALDPTQRYQDTGFRLVREVTQ